MSNETIIGLLCGIPIAILIATIIYCRTKKPGPEDPFRGYALMSKCLRGFWESCSTEQLRELSTHENEILGRVNAYAGNQGLDGLYSTPERARTVYSFFVKCIRTSNEAIVSKSREFESATRGYSVILHEQLIRNAKMWRRWSVAYYGSWVTLLATIGGTVFLLVPSFSAGFGALSNEFPIGLLAITIILSLIFLYLSLSLEEVVR